MKNTTQSAPATDAPVATDAPAVDPIGGGPIATDGETDPFHGIEISDDIRALLVSPVTSPASPWPSEGPQVLRFNAALHRPGTASAKGACGWHGKPCKKGAAYSMRVNYTSGVSVWATCPDGVREASSRGILAVKPLLAKVDETA